VTELSIVIPAWNEEENLRRLLPLLKSACANLGVAGEILVADHESRDGTAELCRAEGVTLLKVAEQGYGRALLAGFHAARGDFVLTMDADLSHPSDFIKILWENRKTADLIIASRYVNGGRAEMPLSRRALSGILNWTFGKVLSVPVKDLSSGFRLYRRELLEAVDPVGRDFNVLQELLVKAYALGYRVAEVPFTYRRRGSGSSHARLLAFGVQYGKTLFGMWRLRNSIASGDYDLRAFDSRLPPQRWWQRKRYRIITGWAGDRGPVLDIGCGSSRIFDVLPQGSVGIDPSLSSLRYARRFGKAVAAGALPDIPVAAHRFDTVICSQVIEHIPASERNFQEFRRLLAPGGQLILGTPDYGRAIWRLTEYFYHHLVPGGYADEHITHFTAGTLTEELGKAGFVIEEKRYIGGGELILRCRLQGE
jgi:dolichol-phosphate mannosyltransferase